MRVITPLNKDFDYETNKQLFDKANNTIGEKCTFDEVISKYQFFSYYKQDEYLGFIYFFYEDGKLFICSASVPKRYQDTYKCLLESLTYYSCDIYANTSQRHVKLILLRAGFKKINDNLFIYERN